MAKPLEIQRDDVLLKFESQLFDLKNNVVDFSVSYFIQAISISTSIGR
ncbi:MAG: hypothetical protein U0V48_07550 [Anaerolineales bacterium]